MKQSLLLMAASMTVAGLSAQSLNLGQKVEMAQKQQLPAGVSVNFSTQAESMTKVRMNSVMQPKSGLFQMNDAAAPKHAFADGVYYKQPAGTMYQNWDSEGRGYGADILRFPAYTDVVFYDESARPALSKWSLGEGDVTADLLEDDGRTINWMQLPLLQTEESFYSYPCLTLTNGRKTYTLGQEGRYYTDYGYATRMTSTVDITPMSFICDHNTEAGYYGWSASNTKHYLFGSGSYVNEDGIEENYIALEQSFPAPISNLFVESIDIHFYSFSENDAIPAGESLTLSIYDKDAEEPFIVLEATADDVTYWTEDDGSKQFIDDDEYGALYMGSIHFAVKGVDAFGTPIEEPFVITDEFTTVVTGFENVEVGFGAYLNFEPDRLEKTYIITDQGNAVSYKSSPFTMPMTFNSLFDAVLNYGDVEATNGETYPSYYVNISEDGASSSNGIFSDLDGALFYTGTPWFSEDGDEHYGAYELPDWITSLEVSLYSEPDEGESESSYCINFTAEPLVGDSRGHFVYIQGRGIVCPDPIFVYQVASGLSDAQFDAAINAAWDMAIANDAGAGINQVIADKKPSLNKTVNLFGQPVDDNFKGIVVVDGKKQIRM